MIIRSKAPLRLGLAGGGTDVSPYSDTYGGAILNVTIDMYAYCTIDTNCDSIISFNAKDRNEYFKSKRTNNLILDGLLDLHKGVYNRIIKDFNNGQPLSFSMTTYSDAPAGSGLGSSSTLVVAMVKAFVEWLNLPLGEYDIAMLAFEIEREDVCLSGGKQDQYAATFGGFNYMEFYSDKKVIVNPLRVKNWIKDELESSMILYYTGASRSSAAIIDEQKKNTTEKVDKTIAAMHELKKSSVEMKEAILKGDINEFAQILGRSWIEKKKTANSISNKMIDDIYKIAIKAGAKAGKVSGAGGGGFMIFVVDPIKKLDVIKALNEFEGKVMNFHFSEGGCHGWKIFKNEKIKKAEIENNLIRTYNN
ncbi:dehydrogenase [Labilibaculum sp. A4]|nr:dehydrogenase [Labilibaculum euxinus]MWN78319.1 dehydrogenase [Labilibaculum euxinus]